MFAAGVVVAAGPAGAADSPAQVAARYGLSEDHVRAADALVGLVFPGAHRDWYDERLVWPDGRRERLSLAGLKWVEAGDGGWWLAAAIQFPDRLERESTRLQNTGQAAEAVRGRIVVARADAGFRIGAHRFAEVDPESLLNSVHLVEIVPPSKAGEWPELRVAGSSAGPFDGGMLAVSWQGTLGGESLAWTVREPQSFFRRGRDGRVTEDVVSRQVDEQGRTTFRGASTGELLPGSCERPCVLAPLAVFEGRPKR